MSENFGYTIAVRPPEYFPRLAYFALLDRVDTFVLADTFQYSRQSYQNRARLRTPQGWQWISVPLAGGQHGRPIHGIEIEGSAAWIKKHGRAFMFNYRSTAYYEYYEAEFEDFFKQQWLSLGDLTCASVALICKLLNVQTDVRRASEMEEHPAGMSEVLRVNGADALFVPASVAAHDRPATDKVRVVRYIHPQYRQNFAGFEAGMSMVDLLYNYGPEAMAIARDGLSIEE